MRRHAAGHRELLSRAWELRANVTFYDGLYVALEERVTSAAAPGIRVDIGDARLTQRSRS